MITLLNAAPDTGNQGVSALGISAVRGLANRGLGPILVADHGRGFRRADWGFTEVRLGGLTHSYRLWRPESLWNARLSALLGGAWNNVARAIVKSSAVLDASGGDSFTDLYGPRRFRAMVLSKRLALDNNVPLILLPQTIGPFRNPTARAEAVRILKAATAVWVRDASSYELLQSYLGNDFDPDRHRMGVDMAVALPAKAPAVPLEGPVDDWIKERDDVPVVGLNVSGLLFNQPLAALTRFGLAERHDVQIMAAARALLESNTRLRLVLVNHVHRPVGHPESDLAAARALKLALDPEFPGRVAALEEAHDARSLKWLLGQFAWFGGARMHATIGAFSSGTPTLAFGYSDKAAGVLASCGLERDVADLRQLDAEAFAQSVRQSFASRIATQTKLKALLPSIQSRAEEQMDVIADMVR